MGVRSYRAFWPLQVVHFHTGVRMLFRGLELFRLFGLIDGPVCEPFGCNSAFDNPI